ncbi:T9SS type A sorting domain-containing protein [Winogradskyella echinorum]|uniref:T9SS type A sorting domain-containing protein n=1 Tax=Winogradskyella echinorum TaxID=538189 RepID=A0ABR6Y0B0_9FLAO|nr:T9SS type A sorting domain-containing protein [Winogradskyella echinorum]MBC3846167.1 T9SS type A sorting domain-containing protein [Winogradskyella echinorum]MBC5750515.1 T9SS type A sorting domain-containing protein [Winogradskyella echinorum]
MKTKLLTLLSILCVLSAKAQIDFTENTVIDMSLFILTPFDVFPADLDGDGDIDLLTSTYSDDKLLWLENLDGIGKDFAMHEISTTIDNPWSAHAADLDNDGDLDVLAAAFGGDHVIWYENTDGNANFEFRQYISAYEAKEVSAHDMDGDGDLDVVWSSNTDAKIKWSRNTDGLGTFASTLNIENSLSSLPNFQVIDVDGDDDLDVVSAWNFDGGTQGVSWYENEVGSGSFSNRITISSTTATVSSVRAGDLDGDGDIDVAATISAENKVVWFENTDGIGTFGPEQLLSDTVNAVVEMRITDFNGDGNLDIIVAANDDNETFWFQNLGSGNFSAKTSIDGYLGGMRDLEIRDFDGDGDQDFVTVTSDDKNIKWYENTDGLGDFSPYTITKTVSGGKVITAADLDGDGDKDILSASHWDDKIAWFENKDGQGDFYNTQKIISETLNGAGSVVAVDIDGDGDNDVIGTSSLDDDVVWYENTDGLGNFGEAQVIEDDLYSVSKAFTSDIDNDGDIDIFCVARGKVVWYENTDGLGNFSVRQEIESINNFTMWSIDFGDLDGDGDLDISVASSYRLLYFLNLDGQGNFGTRQEIEDFYFDSVSTQIADIDGDGDNDIVYTGDKTDTDYVGWSENLDGAGTFSDIKLITTIINNPKDVRVFDIDNDGDLDVVSAAQGNGGVIAWYENTDGLGDFENTQQVISTSLNSPYDLFPTDINQDNNIDIVSISNLGNRIFWYNNMGAALSNQIRGTARFDLLGDGCTVDDALLSGIMVVATNGTSSQAAFTQENGVFRIYTQEEGIVDTQITAQLPNYYQANPTTFQSDFTGFGNSDNINFCIEPVAAISDLNVSAYPIFFEPRPGFDTSYRIVYKNVGTTQLSGSVNFEFDGSKLNFLSATEMVSSQTANVITFDFTDLNPFETKTIDLDFNVFPPPTTNIDDELLTTVSISPISGDITEEDNTLTIEQIVVGSYDPNDITVLEGDEILIEDADKYLHYLIRFQNTGTASAINVKVDHVLDNKLDWSTMQIESLSHTGRVEIMDQTDVSFVFNNIHLPDSTNDEPNSHGFITFKIKPKPNVQVGDIISGVADIYFDFNPAIVTNTVNTQIVEPLSVNGFNFNNLQLYPNPASEKLELSSSQMIDKVAIVDINGRMLTEIEISASSYILDISTFSKGVYFIEIQSGNSKVTKKFIKN